MSQLEAVNTVGIQCINESRDIRKYSTMHRRTPYTHTHTIMNVCALKMSMVPRLFEITSLNKDKKQNYTKFYILIHELGKELGLELSTSIFQCYHKLSGLKSAHLLSQIFCESGVQAQFKQVFYKAEIIVPPRDVLTLECSMRKTLFPSSCGRWWQSILCVLPN